MNDSNPGQSGGQNMELAAYLDQQSESKRLYDRALAVMPGGNSRHTIVMDLSLIHI